MKGREKGGEEGREKGGEEGREKGGEEGREKGGEEGRREREERKGGEEGRRGREGEGRTRKEWSREGERSEDKGKRSSKLCECVLVVHTGTTDILGLFNLLGTGGAGGSMEESSITTAMRIHVPLLVVHTCM